MKISESSVQDALDSGDHSRILPILTEHYGIGSIPDWADPQHEHPLDCKICTSIRRWLSAQAPTSEAR